MFKMMMALSGLLLGGTAMAQSTDQPPTPVRGLEVTVYSATAAGLKWRRSTDDRGVRGYEVYREGELIGEFDALSYVATGLAPGSLNNFTVISVDTAGQRSNASTGIAFETPGGQASVTRPMTPSLRAAVYSSTAAGLAWTRPTDTSLPALRVAQYEVRRDGVLVSTTRDASYIDTTLRGGRTYAYELVAINPLGTRSEIARVSVTTPGGSGGDGGSGVGGDSAVAAPSGLRSVLYSMTAGAIAWDRAASPGFRYEVSRDGSSLGITDGTSYVDSALAGGRSYAYEVVAIDRQGRRSTASRVALSTGGAGGNPVAPVEPPAADPTALDEVSNELIASFAGYRADEKVDDVRELVATATASALSSQALPDSTETFPDGIAFINEATEVTRMNTEYACELGGRLTVGVAELEIRESGFSRDGRAEAFRFEECRVAADGGGEDVLDGALSLLSDADSGNRFATTTLVYEWSDFSLASAGTTVLEADGSTSVSILNAELPVENRTAEFARYVETTADGVLVERLDDTSFDLGTGREGPFENYFLSLSGTLTSSATGGVAVVADTVVDFSRRYRDDDGDPTAEPFTGELSLRAEDGDALTVTARETRTSELFVDRRYTNADGEVRETENVPFAVLTIRGPEESRSSFPE